MDKRFLGSIYIFLGILIIILAASNFIIKLAIVGGGLYLVYKGLQLRNAQNVLFYVNRFWHQRF